MLGIPTSQRVALLIDADNIQLSQLSQIHQFSHYFGKIKIRRAYGDWEKPNLSSHKTQLNSLQIECITVERIGKDSTDKQLMIETIEILCMNSADVFVIASGDADFRQLYERIKQRGKTVIGVGNKAQSSPHLLKDCDSFYYIEELEDIPEEMVFLQEAYLQVKQPDGRADLSKIGKTLRTLDPKYADHFGKKLSKWIDNHPHMFKRKKQYISPSTK